MTGWASWGRRLHSETFIPPAATVASSPAMQETVLTFCPSFPARLPHDAAFAVDRVDYRRGSDARGTAPGRTCPATSRAAAFRRLLVFRSVVIELGTRVGTLRVPKHKRPWQRGIAVVVQRKGLGFPLPITSHGLGVSIPL